MDYWKHYCEHDPQVSPLSSDLSKMWILSSWWTIWKAGCDYLFWVTSLRPPRMIILVNKLVEGVSTHNVKLIQWANYKVLTSREISNKEDVLIFSDATFRKCKVFLVLAYSLGNGQNQKFNS